MDIKECQQLVSHLLGLRARRESAWHELSRWIGSPRGVFPDGEYHDRFETKDITLFRAIPAQAMQKGASGLTSGMTPRNAPWFKPVFYEKDMEELSGSRQWLDLLDMRMQDLLEGGGFYQAIQQFNMDLIWAGCALIFSERSDVTTLRFETQQVGSFCVGLDEEGRLQTVARLLRMTPKQMAGYFGEEKLCEATKKQIKDEPYAEKKVWHVVTNKANFNPDKDNFPYLSLYYEDRQEEFLRKSGYYEMPFFFTVWAEGETVYGVGPGDDCLADAKQIDMMERRKLEGLGKLINPPVACPPSLKEYVDLAPGGINYVGPNDSIKPIIDLGPYATSIKYLQEEIQNVAGRIQEGLMANIFASMPLDQRPANMSATEFLERKREALQQIGPVISAYEPNVLQPLLMRVAMTLDREGLSPPLPQALEGRPVYMKMDFISPMANALRQSGAEAARALISDIGGIFQMTQNAEVFDKIDLDQTVDELAAGIGAPGAIIRSDEDVEQIRRQRQQAQQQQQQMQEAAQGLAITQQAQAVAANQQMMQQGMQEQM